MVLIRHLCRGLHIVKGGSRGKAQRSLNALLKAQTISDSYAEEENLKDFPP